MTTEMRSFGSHTQRGFIHFDHRRYNTGPSGDLRQNYNGLGSAIAVAALICMLGQSSAPIGNKQDYVNLELV
jgi:hypothetical protein